jgi:hypothetical protein
MDLPADRALSAAGDPCRLVVAERRLAIRRVRAHVRAQLIRGAAALIASSAESVEAPTAETGTGAASGDDMEFIIEEGYRWQPDQIGEVAEPPEPEPVRRPLPTAGG